MISRRVLIVEDEGMVAMLLEDMLADLGHQVVARAVTVQEATNFIGTVDIDFAILDVNLNGERTYSLAETLTARGIPFAFSTGYANDGIEPRWRSAPALQKPFQLEELDRVIDHAISLGACK
jgi:CheY-like chemotaxis protein